MHNNMKPKGVSKSITPTLTSITFLKTIPLHEKIIMVVNFTNVKLQKSYEIFIKIMKTQFTTNLINQSCTPNGHCLTHKPYI